jgi:hypothetical protein
MSTTKYSFRFSDGELAAARVAAAREGTALAEFVRRAVAERAGRVGGSNGTSSDNAGVNDIAKRLSALVDQIAADHSTAKTEQDEAMSKLNKAGQGLAAIERRLGEVFVEATK